MTQDTHSAATAKLTKPSEMLQLLYALADAFVSDAASGIADDLKVYRDSIQTVITTAEQHAAELVALRERERRMRRLVRVLAYPNSVSVNAVGDFYYRIYAKRDLSEEARALLAEGEAK